MTDLLNWMLTSSMLFCHECFDIVSDVDDVFKTLKVQFKEAGLSTNFLGVLQNFLIMPIKNEQG